MLYLHHRARAAANLAGRPGVRVIVIGDAGTGMSNLVVRLPPPSICRREDVTTAAASAASCVNLLICSLFCSDWCTCRKKNCKFGSSLVGPSTPVEMCSAAAARPDTSRSSSTESPNI